MDYLFSLLDRPSVLAGIVVAGCLCYVVWWHRILREPGNVPLSTTEKAVEARERLIATLHGDSAAADRLIEYEQRRAGLLGCGKLEAAGSALSRLQYDRSRGQWP